uniref:Contactin-5 n=1 Tax=Sphaerodactylus townsendi TaxID=933632 RepID=A0ACB8FGH6_9SAUR
MECVHVGSLPVIENAEKAEFPIMRMDVIYVDSAIELKTGPRDRESADYGPVFIQEPDSVIFPTDSDEKKISFSCQAQGNPAPTYRWLRNGTEIDTEDDYRYSLIEGSIIINNPSETKDAGQYQCLTTNVFGSILSREATLQFAYHPREEFE